MVKSFGIYEVDEKEGFIRIPIDGKYEYIVSKAKYGEVAKSMCNLFSLAYNLGQTHNQEQIKKALGL